MILEYFRYLKDIYKEYESLYKWGLTGRQNYFSSSFPSRKWQIAPDCMCTEDVIFITGFTIIKPSSYNIAVDQLSSWPSGGFYKQSVNMAFLNQDKAREAE